MLKKFLPIFLFAGFSLNAYAPVDDANFLNQESTVQAQCLNKLSDLSTKNRYHYAVFSSQAEVLTGNNFLWNAGSQSIPEQIYVDNNGFITLPYLGNYLIQYTVRINKTPFDGTATATVQLQQTFDGVPTNIGIPAITSNTTVDGVTAGVPSSQTQITGYALIHTSSESENAFDNVINLVATLSNSSVTIPATSGLDANAQITIIQLH